MRIGFGATAFDPSFCRGRMDGIGVYGLNLFKALSDLFEASAGLSLHPLVFPHSLRRPPPALADARHFSWPYPAAVAAALALGLLFRDRGRVRLDLFHATDHRIPKLKRVPVIATLHDAVPLQRPDWAASTMRGMKNRAMRAAAAWAEHFIAVSGAAVPDLVEHWGIREERISVVHHGVAERWFARCDEAQRQGALARYGLRPGYCLFVGTLQPRKNVQRIIQAHRLLPAELRRRHPLVIVGREGWNAQPDLEQIRRLVHAGAGTWLRYVADPDLPALYQAAAVFVFPSLYEGFGLPVLEAFASGVPVVTSRLSALPEVAGNAALLVDPYCVEELSDALRRVLCDEELGRRLSALGDERARELTWTKCARETLGVYSRVLDGATLPA